MTINRDADTVAGFQDFSIEVTNFGGDAVCASVKIGNHHSGLLAVSKINLTVYQDADAMASVDIQLRLNAELDWYIASIIGKYGVINGFD